MRAESVPVLTLTPSDIPNLAEALHPYHAIYGPCFGRNEPRLWAARYLHGLLSPLERKSVEAIVSAQIGVSEKAIRGMQQFLTDSKWDDAAMLRRHWHEVASDLDHAEGMLILDSQTFPKKGQHSVGVKRQYCRELGKTTNCQMGVFLTYASSHGATLLDSRLYLPQEWLEDPAFAERRRRGRIPESRAFLTKSELGLEMVRSVAASRALRCRWFLVDEVFGRDTALLDAIDDLKLWYMAEVALDTPVWDSESMQATTPQALFHTRPDSGWLRETVSDGKDLRATEALVRRAQASRDGLPGPKVWLVLRMDPKSGEQKAFLSNAPAKLAPAQLIALSALHWPVKQCLRFSKQQLGMGDYEVRSWPGWHHHMTLVSLAHFFLVRRQRRLKRPLPDSAHHS